MSLPSASQVRGWVAQAARAPSAHNVQPARWRLDGDTIELHEDTSRWLAAGDPTGRDATIGLGMAWEGFALAAGADGWRLVDEDTIGATYPPDASGTRRRARARFERGGEPDVLAAAVGLRRCWRGRFPTAPPEARERLATILAAHAGIAVRAEPAAHDAFAAAHHAASIDLLRDRAVGAELRDWLRLSSRDPRAARDGLDAACLGLSAFEAAGARVLMRPAVAAALAAIGLGGLLVDEASKTRSASAIAVIAAAGGVDAFAAGRRWYRFWLALAREGFAAVPMSALVDTVRGRAALATLQPLPAGWRALNAMRIGPAPHPAAPVSARLPADELLEVVTAA